MNSNELRIWTKVNALLVEVESMKADNKARELYGQSLAYTGDNFRSIAIEIEQLSQQIK